MRSTMKYALAVVAISFCFAGRLWALPVPITVISVDENGNAYITEPGFGFTISYTTDPLTYSLPFAVQEGSLLICETGLNKKGDGCDGEKSDLIVWANTTDDNQFTLSTSSTLTFYSKVTQDDKADSLADKYKGDPFKDATPDKVVVEVGPEAGPNGYTWNPAQNGIGSPEECGTRGGCVSYSFLSDPATTAVPEPASITLLGAGLVGLAARMRRRRQRVS